jgi:two-component system, OmpR family, sensor kinase
MLGTPEMQGKPPPDRGPNADGRGGPPNQDLILTTSTMPPLPAAHTSADLSAPLRDELARLLRVEPKSVRLYADKADRSSDGRSLGDAVLHGSVSAARELSDSRWRIITRVGTGFPTTTQKRAVLLFAVGFAVLLAPAWLLARSIVIPVQQFSEAAKRFGQDGISPVLLREGPPEICRAVDSFNAMQARIQRLIQERTQTVGAIAHDLRTPLTRLAFRLDDLPSPLQEKVSADIQEMKSMIAAALDFLRDRSLSGQHERLDFRTLVERVANDQGDLGHDVTLTAGPPVILEGSPLALRRMVANLVDNAIKYGERVRLRLRAESHHCELEIDDDGPGIPERLQQQIFEPFFRLESSRNRDTGGIGLGLATVRGIVLDHGGEISVQNRKGGGLRMTVSLPLPET